MSTDEWKLLAVVIVSVVGGNMGSVINTVDPNIRADPFTGTMARELHRLIDSEMERERKLLRSDILSEIGSREYKRERECEADKQKIRDRLSIVERNQEHCLNMIQKHEGVLKKR